jgi:response regulator RpfG family c-di-GMP phosphodiesterase
MLCDPDHEHLIPYFSFGTSSKFIHHHRPRIGRGVEGNMAKTGEFHLSRNSIGVPFIEEDVVGVILLWDKLDHQPFTKTDLEILRSLSEQAVVAIKNAKLYEETEQLTLGSIKTINELLDLHMSRDSASAPLFRELVLAVGRELQLSGRELIQLDRAISLVDTGALTFPGKVWNKKGKLTKKEFGLIKKIPLQGANLLRSIASLKPVIPIIRHYRERFDGKGYPEGLKGDQIPIGARIISVVDAFVAMISERTYRETKTIAEALDEINDHTGTQFDPHVVECFLSVIKQKEMFDKLKHFKDNSDQLIRASISKKK